MGHMNIEPLIAVATQCRKNAQKGDVTYYAILPLRHLKIQKTIENTAAEATLKNKKGTNNHNNNNNDNKIDNKDDFATALLTPTSIWARKAQPRAGMSEHKRMPTKAKYS